MVKRGYEVFMYDMTIADLPWHHKNFHFFKEGIAGRKIEEQSLDTLENFVARNGHENNEHMILKMDVEGAEWDFLANVSSELLSRFDQMVFEFHNMIQPKTATEMESTLTALKKINATHTLVHVHGNNHGPFLNMDGIGVFPDAPEVTYVRNGLHEFEDDDEIFLPLDLDEPCHPLLPDIPLGYWNKG